MEGDGVCFGQHVLQGNQRDFYFDVLNFGATKGHFDMDSAGSAFAVYADDVHAATKRVLGHSRSNAPKSYNTEGLSSKFNALGVGLLEHFELLCTLFRHGAIAVLQRTRHGKQVGHHQFSHALGAGRGRIEHDPSLLLGVSHIDVVHSDATPPDKAQVGAGVDEVLADLGCTAHEDAIVAF